MYATLHTGEAPSLVAETNSSAAPAQAPEPEAGSATSSVVLEASDIHSAYGGVQAVRGVSFEVRKGECVGIIGPNGAGKSTLLDNISGLNRDYTGRVRVLGTDVTRWPMHRRSGLSVARSFQSPRMFGRMTVLSNLMVAPQGQQGERVSRAIFGGWRQAEQRQLVRARELLDQFGLAGHHDSYAAELSGGQERLLELARAMMTNPKVLLLDEPFAGVSPANRQKLVHHLRALARVSSVSIVMVEHRLQWVEQLCDQVIVMAEGRIIAQGSLADVLRHHKVVDAYLGRRATL
jgi:ABC-type branched-subunit amino acid transport system ATPase component